MPRLERSAGFIVYRLVPDAPGGRVYLLLDYGRHWDYAKGHVEPGEDDLAAAVRELREETGIDDPRVVEGFRHPVEYHFRSQRHGPTRKQVIYFLAQTQKRSVILSEEHVGSAFMDYDAALAALTYATARDVLIAAHAFLNDAAATAAAGA